MPLETLLDNYKIIILWTPSCALYSLALTLSSTLRTLTLSGGKVFFVVYLFACLLFCFVLFFPSHSIELEVEERIPFSCPLPASPGWGREKSVLNLKSPNKTKCLSLLLKNHFNYLLKTNQLRHNFHTIKFIHFKHVIL